MKKMLLTCFVLAAIVRLSAQDDTRSFDKFTRIDAATSVEIELIKSNEHKAEIWVEEGDISELQTELYGSRLKIKWEDRGKLWRKDNWKRRAKIKIYYKDLESVSVSAGASVESDDRITADNFDINASSGGNLQLDIRAKVIDVNVSSGGWAEIDGETRKLVVDASSGGQFKGASLEAEEVRAKASSGGNASVWATESIDADASSGGNVRYKGNPKSKDISSSKWSGGSVRSM